MKFKCDHCQAPYSIADDRLAGKILTIRCRRCQNAFTVRDPSSPADAQGAPGTADGRESSATSATDAAPAIVREPPRPAHRSAAVPGPNDSAELEFDAALNRITTEGEKPTAPLPWPRAPRGPVPIAAVAESLRPREPEPPSTPIPPVMPTHKEPSEWYLGIGGKQNGPMAFAALRANISGAAPKQGILVWKAGMAAWSPASEVEALKDLCAAPVAPPPFDALPSDSKLRVAKPLTPLPVGSALDAFGAMPRTMMLDAASVIAVDQVPRRKQPSQARLALTATLGILGVSGAIVGLLIAVGAINLFDAPIPAPTEPDPGWEMLHVRGGGPVILRETKYIQVMRAADRPRRAEARAVLVASAAGPVRQVDVSASGLTGGQAVSPNFAGPSLEMRRLLASSNGFVDSSGPVGPSVAPVAARKERDEPSADDAQRFRKVFVKQYKRNVEGCYNRALKTDSTLKGSVVLAMELNERSRIKSVSLSRFGASPFEACIKESATTWKFPGVTGGTMIEYTVNLSKTE